MKTRYEWAPGYRAKIAAQIVGIRLEKIRKLNRGALTAKIIVNDARPKRSLLHSSFEWNDAAAAELHREQQAREIIRHVRIIVVQELQPVQKRVYIHVEDSKRGPCYVNIAQALNDHDLRAQMLDNALSELKAFQTKYAELKELAKVFDEIKAIESGIDNNGGMKKKAV